jgi:hypothetical protein
MDLHPPELIARARRLPQDAFVASLEDVPFLLVRISPSEDRLFEGLVAHGHSGKRLPATPTPLSFATRCSTGLIPRNPAGNLTHVTLQTILQSGKNIAVPMRKREAGRAYSHRLSVGRATNNDIVLRDESISKFHAWFEYEDGAGYHVMDARSKNATKVNGRALPPLEAELLSAGDTIELGNVRCIFCPPAMLWQALVG